MLYREMGKTGDKVSILGYGCLHFPKKNGKVDKERVEKQFIYAIEQGVNYFDTGYIYPDSETLLGNTLAKGYRDKVMIADKLPLTLVYSQKDMEKILDTQLKRLQTDYIDYYMMHSIMSWEGWRRLKQIGVEEFLEKAKQDGKIGRIGFSYHGDKEQFKMIVDDYPWDMCQIQYNYMDEHYQAGKEGLMYAASKGLGVVAMEPLRGGYLVRKMPPQIQAIWEEAEVRKTPAEWALRWVWNQPEVTVVLSGMDDESYIKENINIANSAYPNTLSGEDLKLIEKMKESLAGMMKIGCTGCGYCLPCPAGVDIPGCFSWNNSYHLFGEKRFKYMYLVFTVGSDIGTPNYASLCRNCGKCEKICPQSLAIRKHLQEVAEEMEGFYFKPAVSLLRAFYKILGMFKGKA